MSSVLQYDNSLELVGRPSISKDKTWGVIIDEIPTETLADTKKGFTTLIENGNLIVNVVAKNGKKWQCLVSELAWFRKQKEGPITAKVKVTEIVDPNRRVYIPEGNPCFCNLGKEGWGVRFADGMEIPDVGTQVEVEKRGGRFKTVILGEMVKEETGYKDFFITPWSRKKKE